MYPNVYSSNGHGRQTVERTKMPFNRRMDKEMWYIFTMEYYACIRTDDYPTFVSTWTRLEEMMLIEISQQRESIIMWFHLFVEHNK